jgi:hypothetical protein
VFQLVSWKVSLLFSFPRAHLNCSIDSSSLCAACAAMARSRS